MTLSSIPTRAAQVRREDLARFLRTRRDRISPTDVGLPDGRRRRTPGLRREEVAQLAGVGVTWYTWLEQGRPINASVQVLDAIARTLRLNRAEREHLYLLAGLPTLRDPLGEALPAEVQSILDALVPLPAVIHNGRYDVLAWNRTYATMFPAVVRAPEPERNTLWQSFVVPCCCSVMVEREAELIVSVATLRAAFARHVGEPGWTSFVDSLLEASAEFAAMWARHDVAAPQTRTKAYRLARGGRVLRLITTSFAVVGAPDARLMVSTPMTEEDRAELERISDGPPVDVRCPAHRSSRRAAKVPSLDRGTWIPDTGIGVPRSTSTR